MDILGALTAIQQTITITKDLRNIDEKIDAATWKIRLSDLIDKLIDTKDALMEAKERERELREEIDRLKSQLNARATYEDQGGLLFEIDIGGARFGEPFCYYCHVKEDRRFRLRHFEASTAQKAHFKCDNCETVIVTGPALPHPTSTPKRGRGSWMA